MEPWPGEFKRKHQFKADEVDKVAEIKLMFKADEVDKVAEIKLMLFIEKLKLLRYDNPNDADFGHEVAKLIKKDE